MNMKKDKFLQILEVFGRILQNEKIDISHESHFVETIWISDV